MTHDGARPYFRAKRYTQDILKVSLLLSLFRSTKNISLCIWCCAATVVHRSRVDYEVKQNNPILFLRSSIYSLALFALIHQCPHSLHFSSILSLSTHTHTLSRFHVDAVNYVHLASEYTSQFKYYHKNDTAFVLFSFHCFNKFFCFYFSHVDFFSSLC